MLAVSGVASSKSPRLTLASLAMQEFSVPDQSATSRTKVKSGSAPEINIEIKQPAVKKSKRANYDEYYATRGYVTTTVTAAATSGATTRARARERNGVAICWTPVYRTPA